MLSAGKFVSYILLVIATTRSAMSEPATARFAISPQRVVAAMAFAGIAVKPDQIELISPVSSATLSATMQVVSISKAGAGTGTVRAKLRCGDNRECLPFYVLVHGADRVGEGLLGTRVAARSKPLALASLVRGGDRATLTLESPDSRMILPVICLQSGMRGQRIRAASLDRKKFYDAEIVAAGLLKGTF